MSKRGKTRDKASRERMQALDDPTAAFPIGALGQIAKDLSDEHSEEDLPEVGGDDIEPLEPEEVSVDASPSPRARRIGYLMLSLIGGGLAAFVIGLGIVFLALVVQQR